MKPATEAEYVNPTVARTAATAPPKAGASACAIAAALQTSSASEKPRFVPSRSISLPAKA